MIIDGKTVLVTGTSRGIGQALVEEALQRGAARVYAAARHPVAHPDELVTPLTMDVSDAKQIQQAAVRVESLDLLINNAGIQPFDDLSGPVALEQALAVNLFGPYRVSQAFLPALARTRERSSTTCPWRPLPLCRSRRRTRSRRRPRCL